METITVPYVTFQRRVLTRFVKMFLLGGISALGVALAQGKIPTNVEELKAWLPVLAVAFIVGGLAAIEKASQEWLR